MEEAFMCKKIGTKMIWNSPAYQKELDSALSWAANVGDAQRVKQLVFEQGANPNALNPNPPFMLDETPFKTAVVHDHAQICEILIDAGADPLKRDIHGKSPYFHAIVHGREDAGTFPLLIKAGVDDQAFHDLVGIDYYIEQFGGTKSSRKFFTQYVEKIIEKYLVEKKDVSEIDKNKVTLLHYAAQCQLEDACKQLIESGADVNAKNVRNETPLHFAVSGDNAEICNLLLRAGADMYAKATTIRTIPINPISAAIKNENPKIFETLCFHGIKIHQSPYLEAIARNNPSHLHFFVFAPALDNVGKSKSYVFHILWCFKQMQPILPKDVLQMILASGAKKELALIMISRKLHGKPIPETMNALTLEELYNYTLFHLTRECDSASFDPAETKAIDGITFEKTYGPALKRTIATRLAQPTLVCNNPGSTVEELSTL